MLKDRIKELEAYMQEHRGEEMPEGSENKRAFDEWKWLINIITLHPLNQKK